MELYKHNDRCYLVRRRIAHTFFINKEGQLDADKIKAWRDYLPNVDHVLRNETHYLFVETIQDAEIIEDNTEEMVD
jgi:hypothetical protein